MRGHPVHGAVLGYLWRRTGGRGHAEEVEPEKKVVRERNFRTKNHSHFHRTPVKWVLYSFQTKETMGKDGEKGFMRSKLLIN